MTPDEIRTLAAGPDADVYFAAAVGIPEEPPGPFLHHGTMELIHPDGTHFPWHPSTDTGQAMDAAAKWLAEKGGWRLECYPKDFNNPYCFVAWTQHAFARSAALAVVRGVLLVAAANEKPA